MDGRVGKHTQDGRRNCQNWVKDQEMIIELLNRIPVSAGGAGGSLATGPLIPGVCSDALYDAISRFEDKHFGTQHSGFVDPGGKMLDKMRELAKAPTPAAPKPAAQTRLDILRYNVLNLPKAVIAKYQGDARWTAGDRVQLDGLIKAAVNHIDDLKGQKDKAGEPLRELPNYARVFGTAWVGHLEPGSAVIGYDGSNILKREPNGSTTKLFAQTNYGTAAVRNTSVSTTPLFSALIIFFDSLCFPSKSNTTIMAAEAHEYARTFMWGPQ